VCVCAHVRVCVCVCLCVCVCVCVCVCSSIKDKMRNKLNDAYLLACCLQHSLNFSQLHTPCICAGGGAQV